MADRTHWYRYSARDLDGTLVTGFHRAASDDDVALWLRRRRLVPGAVEPAWWAVELYLAAPTRQELLHFTEFLADLLTGEMSAGDALGLLRQERWTPPFRRVLGILARDVQANAQLHEAMARHPRVFDRTYRELVAAGLASGQLDRILADHARQMDKQYALRKKVATAMIYPVLTAVVLAVSGYVLVTRVVPVFADLFAHVDAQLPPVTVFVLGVSALLREHGGLLLGGLLAAGAGVVLGCRRPAFRRQVHRLALRVPVFGPILECTAVAAFCRTFSTLHRAGLNPVPALLRAAATVPNLHVAAGLADAAARMAKGTPPEQALKASEVIPAMVMIRVSVASRTGDLPLQMARAAAFFEREADSRVAQVEAAMTPVIVAALGLVLGVLVVACLMPLQSLMQAIRQ